MLSLFSRGRDAPQDGLSKGTTPPRQFVPKVKARKRPSLIARSMARLGLPGSGQSAEPADGALLLVTDNILVMDPRHALPVHRACGAWGLSQSAAAMPQASATLERVLDWCKSQDPESAVTVIDCGVGACMSRVGGGWPLGRPGRCHPSLGFWSTVLRASPADAHAVPNVAELADAALACLRSWCGVAPAPPTGTHGESCPPRPPRAVLILAPSATSTVAIVVGCLMAAHAVTQAASRASSRCRISRPPRALGVAMAAGLPLSQRPGALPAPAVRTATESAVVLPRTSVAFVGAAGKRRRWSQREARSETGTAAASAAAAGVGGPDDGSPTRASRSPRGGAGSPTVRRASRATDAAVDAAGLDPGSASSEAAAPLSPGRSGAGWLLGSRQPRVARLVAAVSSALRPPQAARAAASAQFRASVSDEAGVPPSPDIPPGTSSALPARAPHPDQFVALINAVSTHGSLEAVGLPSCDAITNASGRLHVAFGDDPSTLLSTPGLRGGLAQMHAYCSRAAPRWSRLAVRWAAAAAAARADKSASAVTTEGSAAGWAVVAEPSLRTGDLAATLRAAAAALARSQAAAPAPAPAAAAGAPGPEQPCSASAGPASGAALPGASSRPPREAAGAAVAPATDAGAPVGGASPTGPAAGSPDAPTRGSANGAPLTAVLRWVEISHAPLTSESCSFTPGVTVVDRGPEGGARILFSSNVRGRRVYASGSGPVLVPVDCLVTGLTTVRLADVASRWRDPDPDEDGPQLVMENNVVAAISVHPSTLVPRPAELALADSLAGLAGPGSDSDAGAGACTCKGAVGAAAASTAATAASSPAASGSGSGFEPWTASVTFDRAQCGIPAADHRFPDGFCVSLVFSSVPDAAPWKLYRSVKEGVVSDDEAEAEAPVPRVFAVAPLDAPAPPRLAFGRCVHEDCGVLTPIPLRALQASAGRGPEFTASFDAEDSGSGARADDPPAAFLRRSRERARRKGARLLVPRGAAGRRALDLPAGMPWGDSNSDSSSVASDADASDRGAARPGDGGAEPRACRGGLLPEGGQSRGDRLRLAVDTFRSYGADAARRAALEARRASAVLWAGGGGGFPLVTCACVGCGRRVQVPPTMSVACGEAEECMVCAPYEDDTAAQHAEPAADTEAHPFEVDSRSRAGEGAAVAALAAASRRRQAGLDQELGRILAATRLAVPREVASEAQALLGTAGASDEDLILVLAVLEARGAGASAPAGRASEAGGSGRAGTAGAPDDDASIAARLQAAEMRESGASEAEVEQFLQGAGVAAAEAGPARRGAPPGVVSGRAPAAPSTAASAATAPAAPADPSARSPGGPTTRTRAGGATAPPGPSAYASRARSTRESARIAATVRGTVFGRASMKGASPEEVDRLAVIGITAEDLATARATEDDSVPSSDVPESVRARGRPSAACVVCCEDYEEGERVRVLPCLHRMHVRCIDPWLLIKAECPVCHESSRGGMNKDVVALVRALSDAAAEGFEGHDERVRDLLAGFLPAGMAGVDAVFRRYFAAVEAAKH